MKLFRNVFTVILTVSAFTVAFSGCSDKKSNSAANDSTLPSAEISGAVDGDTVKFSIKVPAEHHAYLDSGKDGNLIPVAFQWKEGFNPSLQSHPKGVYEDFFHATVLRGTGEWVFHAKNASDLKGTSVKVTTQLCDDTKGICYKPSKKEITLN